MDLEMEIKLCPVEEIVLPLPQQLILPQQQQTLPVSVSISDSTELLLDDINLDNKDSEIIDPNQGNDSDSEDENENENEIEDGVETEIGFPVVF